MAAVPPIPAYIQSLCEEVNGNQLVHITKNKIITQFDLDKQQCRLRLPTSSARAIQENWLSLNQAEAANFFSEAEMESLVNATFLTEADVRRAMELKGVNVQVYVLSPGKPRMEGQGILTKWWNNDSIVIHGRQAMREWSHLNEGDLVELWGFNDEEHKLYLAVDKL